MKTKTEYDFPALIERFLRKEISAKEFEREYHEAFIAETGVLTEELYEPLNWLFSEAECYSDLPPTPGIDPHFHVTEEQLRKSAQKTLEKLKNLYDRLPGNQTGY